MRVLVGPFKTQKQIKIMGLHPGDGSYHILNLKSPPNTRTWFKVLNTCFPAGGNILED